MVSDAAWKQLIQPQGKLFPAMQMFPVLAMHSTRHLPTSQSFPDNQPGLPSRGRVTPPVTLPQLLLCFCQLARAKHCFPQGPNKGPNAWPGASLPIPIGSAQREGWQIAPYFYCSFSQTSKHQEALLRNIVVISVPGSQADLRNLLSPGE